MINTDKNLDHTEDRNTKISSTLNVKNTWHITASALTSSPDYHFIKETVFGNS